VLRQVDQTIGGAQGGGTADANRTAFARRLSAHAAAQVGKDSGDLLARYQLAFASWFLETDHHTAMQEMLEINRQDPRNAMNHGFLGYCYADRKDATNTIAQWEEATRLDPSNSLLHYMLGSAYSRVGRSRDAALQFAQAYRDRTLYNYITRGEQP
jgi:Flp pilus assembly protein TadD